MLLMNCSRIRKKTNFSGFVVNFSVFYNVQGIAWCNFFLASVFFLVRRFFENLINFAIGREPEKKHKVYVRVYRLIFRQSRSK